MQTLDFVGLAAGGVVGSGWLMSASKTYETAGDNAYWAWVIGGALMLLIAVVMVELGIAAPKTGGLIFLPLHAAGPLLAAALWIAYAANPASQAAAAAAHGLKDLLPGEEALGDHNAAQTGDGHPFQHRPASPARPAFEDECVQRELPTHPHPSAPPARPSSPSGD